MPTGAYPWSFGSWSFLGIWALGSGHLINERIRPQVAEQVLALTFVVHEVEPLAVVLALGLLLGHHEQLAERVPGTVPAEPPDVPEHVVALRADRLQDIVLRALEV